MRDVLELRRERVHALPVHSLERGRIEARWRRECNADVRARAEGHRRLSSIRASIGRDGRAEERPLMHGFCERLEEDGEVREVGVVATHGDLGGCWRGMEGCGGDDL